MLGICCILHESKWVEKLKSLIEYIIANCVEVSEVYLYLTPNCRVDFTKVKDSIHRLPCKVNIIQDVDDILLDYTYYFDVTSKLRALIDVNHFLFFNDTVFAKHNSLGYGLREICKKIKFTVLDDNGDNAIMIGPYCKSEYSTGLFIVDEFIGSYFFYLNLPGLRLLEGLAESQKNFIESELKGNIHIKAESTPCPPQIHKDIFSKAKQVTRINEYYLKKRKNFDQNLVERKKITIIYERMLSVIIKTNGMIWYTQIGGKAWAQKRISEVTKYLKF